MTLAKPTTHFPTKEQVAAFIRDSATPVGRREIARAFNVKGEDRKALRALISELAEDGEVETGRKRKVAAPGALPEVAVVEITKIDGDGELQARPISGLKDVDEANLPKITILTDRRSGPMAVGDRALARLEPQHPLLLSERLLAAVLPALEGRGAAPPAEVGATTREAAELLLDVAAAAAGAAAEGDASPERRGGAAGGGAEGARALLGALARVEGDWPARYWCAPRQAARAPPPPPPLPPPRSRARAGGPG